MPKTGHSLFCTLSLFTKLFNNHAGQPKQTVMQKEDQKSIT
jgi:hypothetical protein